MSKLSEIEGLCKQAVAHRDDANVTNAIAVKLAERIPGYSVPNPADGPVATRIEQVFSVFADFVNSTEKSDTHKLAKQLHRIIYK